MMFDRELYSAMRLCGHHLHRMTDGRAGQGRLLSILLERDGITQREMQDIVDVRSGTLSEVLGKLEAAELIERRASEADRRMVRVHLTEAGRRVAQEQEGAREEQLSGIFNCFSAEEKAQLRALIDRLNAHLETNLPHPGGGWRGGRGRGGRGCGQRHGRERRREHD
ncbi:MAG: MarR family winged helix-turn-helix transcriptional regulator [Christensenellales bacterium]|jgi:DNA-binding MarR family transcriptional regulator